MNEISSNENISSNYLSIYIKKTTLMGITDILSFIRTHESEKILLSKDIGIIDVAYECGFSDQKLYYKTFKNLYGCTPNQHRKKMRELVYASETNNVIDIEGEKSMLEHAMLTVISIYN
jgi:AraC-like DNA-binding protein